MSSSNEAKALRKGYTRLHEHDRYRKESGLQPFGFRRNHGMPEQIGNSSGRLRIALVFPPAMHPMSPPLGIAALKAHLSRSESVCARAFDLNLTYYDRAFEWLGDGRLQMSILKMDRDATMKKATAARNFFRGEDGLERFFDQGEYNAHARIYSGFESVLNGLFEQLLPEIVARDAHSTARPEVFR